MLCIREESGGVAWTGPCAWIYREADIVIERWSRVQRYAQQSCDSSRFIFAQPMNAQR